MGKMNSEGIQKFAVSPVFKDVVYPKGITLRNTKHVANSFLDN